MIQVETKSNKWGKYILVDNINKLPLTIGNEIFLESNTCYLFTNDIDFNGKVLVLILMTI